VKFKLKWLIEVINFIPFVQLRSPICYITPNPKEWHNIAKKGMPLPKKIKKDPTSICFKCQQN